MVHLVEVDPVQLQAFERLYDIATNLYSETPASRFGQGSASRSKAHRLGRQDYAIASLPPAANQRPMISSERP